MRKDITGKKIIAIIPARGGSKGVPRKNIKPLCGEALIYYSIKAGLESKYIDRVVVSTEDDEIASVAEKFGAEVIERPDRLARDDTPSVPVFKHVLSYLDENEKYLPDIVVILQPTSPLRKAKDIDDCIEKLIQEKCDSVITVKKVDHPPQWMVKLGEHNRVENLFKQDKVTRRQDAEDVFIPNGADGQRQ